MAATNSTCRCCLGFSFTDVSSYKWCCCFVSAEAGAKSFVTSSVWWIVHRNTKVTLHIRRTFVHMSASPSCLGCSGKSAKYNSTANQTELSFNADIYIWAEVLHRAQGIMCATQGEKRKMPPLKKKEFHHDCIKAALNSVLPCFVHMSLCNCCMLNIHIYPVFVYKGASFTARFKLSITLRITQWEKPNAYSGTVMKTYFLFLLRSIKAVLQT